VLNISEHTGKHKRIFALDIGTRTLIGLVAELEEGKIKIIAQEMMEHDSRSMHDGQIHDIPLVSKSVLRLKASLEKKVGYELRDVAIAAAGRSLKTKRGYVEKEISEYEEIDELTVRGLELLALDKVRKELTFELESGRCEPAWQENVRREPLERQFNNLGPGPGRQYSGRQFNGRQFAGRQSFDLGSFGSQSAGRQAYGLPGQLNERFHCVGHCVLNYYLDGFSISNLVGHRGRLIGVDIVATFLPESVVNSIFSVLRRSDLNPVNLTLEPIAAIDAAVPEGLRLLNLALVDIGAGTSDLAVTRKGSVIAYGMVPLAGDEITEAIAEGCLVDFKTAELIKRRLPEDSEITYTDVLGFTKSVSRDEVLRMIEPVIDNITGEIAENIREMNGGEFPKAVYCVGGGAQVPTLTEKLAEKMDLPADRVAVRGREALQELLPPEEDDISGPEGVTVVGIASLALKRPGYVFANIIVNGKEYRVFNAGDMNVSYVLGFIEYDSRNLFGRNGKDLTFTFNSSREVVPGELSRPAEIYINGEKGNLKSPVHDGDEIIVKSAKNGRDARAFVRDFLFSDNIVNITFNGKKITLHPHCTLNDRIVSPDTEIKNGDRLVIDAWNTVGKIVKRQGLDPAAVDIFVNGEKVGENYIVKDGDGVEIVEKDSVGERGVSSINETVSDFSVSGLGAKRSEGSGSAVNGTGNRAVDEEKSGDNSASGSAGDMKAAFYRTRVMLNGREVIIRSKEKPLFFDIFNYIDLDPYTEAHNPVIKLNGRDAQYTEPIKDGDVIEISLKNKGDGNSKK